MIADVRILSTKVLRLLVVYSETTFDFRLINDKMQRYRHFYEWLYDVRFQSRYVANNYNNPTPMQWGYWSVVMLVNKIDQVSFKYRFIKKTKQKKLKLPQIQINTNKMITKRNILVNVQRDTLTTWHFNNTYKFGKI